MKRARNLQTLARRYLATLRQYLAHEAEATLEEAYEVGRAAMAAEFGILDMARVHLQALEKLLRSDAGGKNRVRISKLAGMFFLQALSPFEATHRGFREMNAELLKRNQELAAEIRERQRTEKALRESEMALQDLSHKILRAQEEERQRISRELHDEVGQLLTAISVTLAGLRGNGAAKSASIVRKVAVTQRLLEGTMETVHRFARELRPAMLDELGLLPALRSYMKNFSARTCLRVHFSADPLAEQMDGERKTALFRIAQECLTNVAKHARASRVNVSIREADGGICMEVADNGRSFRADPGTVGKQKQQLGLLGMQERVRLLDGQFCIKPVPGLGTTVCVTIPFRAAATAQT